jgi:hypothetical protein
MSDQERERRIREERERMKRAEEYSMCPIHNRRIPMGGICPNCAADQKKGK